jgi:hypothetical protein
MELGFHQNRKGKFVILDLENNRVEFDHAVDAIEALKAVDADGNPRYKPFIPKEEDEPVAKEEQPKKKDKKKSKDEGDESKDEE